MPHFRQATGGDTLALMELERAANLVALAHIFPIDRYPFPEDDVLARWSLVLGDPGTTVLVLDGEEGLAAAAAYDAASLRHLAVHPFRWGQGLAGLLVRRAVGAGADRLWCLVDNHRARGLYEHLGWGPTGVEQEAVWPPHPREMEYALGLGSGS